MTPLTRSGMARRNRDTYAMRMVGRRSSTMIRIEPNEPHPWAHLPAWRERAGLTQENVAETFSVSSVTIHRWETGKAPVTVDNLMKLARIYGASDIAELTLHPDLKAQASVVKEAARIALKLPAARQKTWLELGRELSGDQGNSVDENGNLPDR